MSWVFESSKAHGSHRLVLLAIADNADDDGNCWPSIATIARKANLSRTKVLDCLKDLEQAGAIVRMHRLKDTGDKNSNYYTLIKSNSEVVHTGVPRGGSTHGYTTVVHTGVPGVVHTGVLKPSIKPSVNHQVDREEPTRMQLLAERLTGLMPTPADLKTLDIWEKSGVIEDDIRAALQWRKDNGRGPVKTISQLAPGVETSLSMRVQGEAARPGKNGKNKNNTTDDIEARIKASRERMIANGYKLQPEQSD